MAILNSEIKYYLSGGASNTNPAAALGGAISTTEVASNLFDDVSSTEALSGDTEYRCFYVKNTNGSLTLIDSRVFISTNTPSPTTTIEIGLGTSAISGTEQTVVSEQNAPSSVSFAAPSDYASGLAIGDLAPGATKAIWVKRIINASTAAATDSCSITVRGDS